jgi:hypothetical protein
MIISSHLHVLMFSLLLLTTACTAGVSSLSTRTHHEISRDNAATADLELIGISDLVYQGAFRIPESSNGVSSMNFSQGPIAYDAGRHSIFLVGHAHQQAVAEYLVPDLSASIAVTRLKMAQPVQVFSTVLDRMPGGNPERLDRIGGLARYGDQLLVSAYEYYDAPADNFSTHLVLHNARDLAGSAITAPISFQGRAHTAGWMSPIPDELQQALGGTWLAGSSSGEPIIGRLSVGPSAFAFDPEDMSKSGNVATTTLLDFDLLNRLHQDLINQSGENDIWNHLSRAVHGFIPPGTRSYITLGHSGGHNSVVCYKCIPDGQTANCAGYCAKDPSDYNLMYWLWDVQDLIDVREGIKSPYTLRPYDYGVFEVPFAGKRFGGGSYDPVSNRLYLTLQRADRDQGSYSNPPLILVYNVAALVGDKSDQKVNIPGNNNSDRTSNP